MTLAETRARPGRLRISPDGRYLALTEHPVLSDDRGLVVILDRAGAVSQRPAEWASLDGLAWAPGGREVLVHGLRVRGRQLAARPLARRAACARCSRASARLVLHDVAPDGRVLLERATLRSEMLFRRAGESEDRDLSWLDFSAVEGISPDGGTILFYESGAGRRRRATPRSCARRTGRHRCASGSGRALDLSPDGRLGALRRPPQARPPGPHAHRAGRDPEAPAAGRRRARGSRLRRDGRRVFVTGRDASRAGGPPGSLTLDGSAPRKLPLPEGRILIQDTFTRDGSRFVAPCPEDGLPCLYDTVTGRPVPVPGAQKGWIPIGFDAQGRLYFRDVSRRMPETLLRLEPATGRVTPLAELAPRDRAGALGRDGRERRGERRRVGVHRDCAACRTCTSSSA